MPEDPLHETAQQGPAHADRKRATSREDPRREDTAQRRGDRSGATRGGDPSGGRRRRQSETSVRGGVLGIAAVTLATIVISLAGALVALVVSLVF